MRNTMHIKHLSEIKNFSMQNSNTHKCLPVIDRIDKVIHGTNEALANNTQLFSHDQTTFWHAT